MRTNDRQQQYIENQIENKKRKDAICREYPEIQKLDQAKRKWTRILVCYTLVLRIINVTMIIQTKRLNPFVWIGVGLGGFLIYYFFLSFCMGGGAQNTFCLYLIVVNISYTIYKNLKGITSFEMLVRAHIRLYQTDPLALMPYILLYIGFALHLGVAVWLTMVPKNRRLALQFDALMKSAEAGKHSSNISAMAKWTADDDEEE